MSDRRCSLRAAAVLARHRPPAGRRQRNVSAAHRRSTGRVGRRGDAAHRALSGRRTPRGGRRRAHQPRRRLATPSTSGRVWRWSLARIGLGPLRGVRPDVVIDTQNGIPFLARLAYGRRVAVLGAPLPPRTVAGRRAGDGPLRLVRGIPAVAAAAPPQPVRHGVAAVGAGPDVASVWSPTGSPSCATALDEAPAATLTAPAVGNAERRGAVAAGAAQADRGRARRRSPNCARAIPDVHLDILGGGWWEQRLVDHAELLGISDAVTFHGTSTTTPSTMSCSAVGCMCCRREKRAGGWP